MTPKQLQNLVESSSEECLSILSSMKGLLILSEHYANPPETTSYITMLSTCIDRLEASIVSTQSKVRDCSDQAQ